jgi:hypothetical protein
VTIAARLGAALRRSARNASAMKKTTRPTPYRLVMGAPTPISERTRSSNSPVDSSE